MPYGLPRVPTLGVQRYCCIINDIQAFLRLGQAAVRQNVPVAVVQVLVYVAEELAAAAVVGVGERAAFDKVVRPEVLELVRLGHHADNSLTERVETHQHGEQKRYKMCVSIAVNSTSQYSYMPSRKRHYP